MNHLLLILSIFQYNELNSKSKNQKIKLGNMAAEPENHIEIVKSQGVEALLTG